MSTTQQFLPIEDIHDDVVLLKDGSISMVIQTSAVNFDLLSENEQLAIIGSFAALLNSLSFAIQIVIRSERLDISKYLQTLKLAEGKQTNPLLQLMMQRYRQFVSNIIRENEVLDKQFYIVITVSPLELGVVKNVKNFQKAITILIPRRDHIMRQLGRIGLKSQQLDTEKLIRLYYDFYNEPLVQNTPQAQGVFQTSQEAPIPDSLRVNQPSAVSSQPSATQNLGNPAQAPVPPIPTVPVQPLSQPGSATGQLVFQRPVSSKAPFVVEELPDDYGVAR